MVRLVCIGCFHGEFSSKLFNQIKKLKPDAILSFGDYSGSKEFHKLIFKTMRNNTDLEDEVSAKKLRRILKKEYESGKRVVQKLRKLNVPVYAIFGNHDAEDDRHSPPGIGKSLLRMFKNYKTFRYAHRRTFNIKGIRVAAHGGYVEIDTYFKTKVLGESKKMIRARKKHWNHSKKELRKMNLKDVDVFMTHYPAYGYFDKIKNKSSGKMWKKSAGFSGYNEVIKKFKPKVFLNAHMHEYHGVKKLGKTKMVAIGAAMNGKFVLVDMDKDKVKVKLMGKGSNKIY